MTIAVDESKYPFRGQMYCHMMSNDVDLEKGIEELHQMADQLGLKRSWFQPHPTHPHYDVAPSKRKLAVQLGAIEMTSREMAQMILRNMEARGQ